ncbi:MAG: alpha/beta fold hydrolase [Opitutaceae bacterium]|nr:alpha/beta fold hydrolase [Opitutaceae bacterium]
MLELYSRDLGGAGNPPLVVLHGLLGSSRNWLSAGKALAEHWHVLALDLRNHGKSPHGDSMTYEDLVQDVLAWMDRQGWERADFVGHSMGGKVAMCIAIRHPERIKRLVVVDIAPKSYRSAGSRAEFAAMHEIKLPELKSRTEAELKMESRVPDWAMRKFLTTNLERIESGGWRWAINLTGITAALPELEENPLAADETFTGPTLFVLGGKSRYVLEHDHAGIRGHFPKVEIRQISESGHNPHMQNRDEFAELISDWAGSLG